jgi:hypothetical protein
MYKPELSSKLGHVCFQQPLETPCGRKHLPTTIAKQLIALAVLHPPTTKRSSQVCTYVYIYVLNIGIRLYRYKCAVCSCMINIKRDD